jgi:hypothetical protein
MVASVADDPAAAGAVVTGEEPAAEGPAQPATADDGQPLLAGPAAYVPDPAKEQVPDEASLARSRELLKELFAADFRQMRTPQDRKQFVTKLLGVAANFDESPADYYELARVARDLAADLGDVAQVLAACQLLEQRFQIDSLTMRLAALDRLSKQAKASSAAKLAREEAHRIERAAALGDRYDIALTAHELVEAFARIEGDRTVLARLREEEETLAASKRLFAAAERGLATLKDEPNDAAANEALGVYLCLVKDRWQAGLPYLARADDIRLRGIASHELAATRSLDETLSLAEQYWVLAAKFKQPERRGLHLRAVHCYGLVKAKLAAGLETTKAQRRIDEAAAMYGREEIDRILKPLLPRGTTGELSAR